MANLFNLEDDKRCGYKDELYSVRKNGMVYRHPKIGGRTRKYDSTWTFGKVNSNTGYLEIASVTIHRIIATAYHGTPPTPQHVVDHIDTNRQNNRPENLRWVTKLENILLNPITARRIAIVCGSVEEFLEDPSKFRGKFPDPSYDWMCTVSEDEAMDCRERLSAWAKSEKFPIGGSLDTWIFTRYTSYGEPFERTPILIQALTPHALQREWQKPTEFPCCPLEYAGNPIEEYSKKLGVGAIFCTNNTYSSSVYKSTIGNGDTSIYVITRNEDGIKGWALAEITFEDGMFVHTSKGTFFEQNGAEKYYCLAQGLEWPGGDGIDDYC